MSLELLQERYSQFKPREKLLVVLGAVALVYFTMQLLFLDPIAAKHKELIGAQSSLRQDIQNLEQQQVLLLQSMNQDPDRDLKRQLAEVKKQLTALDRELTTLSVGLIPAKQLPLLLQDVLQKTGKLELLSMQTLPVSNLQLQQEVETVVDDSQSVNAEADEPHLGDIDIVNTGVFKHAVELRIRGSYFQILSYLEALEGLTWRFYWHTLDYAVDDYPKAVVTLNVYTLSTEEGLFSG